MTSQQVMLTLALAAMLVGCSARRHTSDRLEGPYPTRRVWAVAPLRNESGSLAANELVMADHLARQLETAANIDTLAVNRTLAAMQALKLSAVQSPQEALQVMNALGADALVVGVINTYDPYDPPKLGMAVELYTNERVERRDALDLRGLSSAATSDQAHMEGRSDRLEQPVSVVSTYLDAADPDVREALRRYARRRGPVAEGDAWRRYRISMDLYSEFVSYVVSWRLLDAEKRRLQPPPPEPQTQTPAPQ